MSEYRSKIIKVLHMIIDYRIKQKWNLQSIKGIVKSVDETARTCIVTVDTFDYPGVWLQGISNLTTGFLQVPTVGSQVLMGRIDNNYYITLFSKLDKVLIDTNLVQFNGGKDGGTPKSSEIGKMIDIVTQLVTIINGTPVLEPGNSAPSALQVAMQGAIAGKEMPTLLTLQNNSIKQ